MGDARVWGGSTVRQSGGSDSLTDREDAVANVDVNGHYIQLMLLPTPTYNE